MSRLKKVGTKEEKAVIQKTVRIPVELYGDFMEVMRDSGIDKFNFAVEKLIEFEVEEWKKEKKRESRKSKKKESKNESKKD